LDPETLGKYGEVRVGRFYYFSAERGLTITCRLSVRLSVCDVGDL